MKLYREPAGLVPFRIDVLILTVFICISAGYAQNSGDMEFKAALDGNNLKISALVRPEIKKVEIRINSSRNNTLVKYTDLSETDPQYNDINTTYPREIWYPTVDLVREPGLEGVLIFDKKAAGEIIVNGPFVGNTTEISEIMTIPDDELVAWENSIVVEPAETVLEDFYLRMEKSVVLRKVEHTFTTLSKYWKGTLELYDITGDTPVKLSSTEIGQTAGNQISLSNGNGFEKQRLQNALDASIDFTMNSQVSDPGSPADKGLYLFYDLDSKTYRNSYWMWGWGPSVKLLLDYARQPQIKISPESLNKAAEQIGRKSMEFQFISDGHKLDKVRVGRWSQSIKREGVYIAAITIADNQFLSGWAWIPLFETTGDSSFLKAAENLSRATAELMDDYMIIPHSYLPEQDRWYNFTICETGFGLEGIAELYRVTGDRKYIETGRRFMKQHQDFFQRDDGLWERQVSISSGKVVPTERHTRGQGWAMEGLLAAHRLYPEGGYLEHATRMADEMIKMQNPEGYWTFYADQTADKVGISEKGTALWCYLMYRLYSHTGEKNHLESARNALSWCLDNQYFGDDREAYGSIPGRTKQSAVGYRRWFKVSCAYTSAFFGLAILEEMKISDR